MKKTFFHRKTGSLPGGFGAYASALFLICLGSGVLLSLHYDPEHSYTSISGILKYNPWASLWRGMHFWSAQMFLVLFIIHLWGFLRKKFFTPLRPGLWLRLVASIIPVFLLMFTGFLLKGDHDSLQAARVFRSLTDALPLAGKSLSFSLLGKPGHFLLPYVHHIATFTILVIIIIREHSRKMWPGVSPFSLSLIAVIIPSLFFIPPLHDGLTAVVKGPWYFLGVQEWLYLGMTPGMAWILLALVLALIVSIRWLRGNHVKGVRYILLIITIVYMGTTLTGLFFRGENWGWTYPGSGVNQSRYPWFSFVFSEIPDPGTYADSLVGKESCLHCHDGFTGFSPGHQPGVIGCYACHGGNIFSLHVETAHTGLRRIPGNLADAGNSCATPSCHPDILPRVRTSLMGNPSGLMAVNRWVFGELSSPDIFQDIHKVGTKPAEIHLRNLCLSCHLGAPKEEPGPVTEASRGGGCIACHLTYDSLAKNDLTAYLAGRYKKEFRKYHHPAIGIRMGNDACFGCHSRSGRIATSYEGWHETLIPVTEAEKASHYRIIGNKRVFLKAGADIHHEKGLLCVDCHSAREVMGDGTQYQHKEEAVKIRCTDCHPADLPRSVSVAQMDYESAKIRRLWKMDSSAQFMVGRLEGKPILGTRVHANGTLGFIGRGSTKEVVLKPPSPACSRGNVHTDLGCSACHTGWAPRCIGCHTRFDRGAEGKDLYTGGRTKGKFTESMSAFLYGPPTLGIVTRENKRWIQPFVPGMIMQVSAKGSNDTSFHRLYAPLEAHTTQKKGRSCVSCHNDPVALGYGAGSLEFRKTASRTGRWFFFPEYENRREDGLPADAWIPFLGKRSGQVSTRSQARPFTVEEQKNILLAGACLTCHEGNSAVMQRSLSGIKAMLPALSPNCLLPQYP